MDLLLAVEIAGVWGVWIRPVLLLVFGLGAVIFVHELGHFLVAKFVGIKVERFALGFGPRLFGFKFKKGETDYCINALPLGGYVKMLGQEDFAPLKDGEADPRAFNNKSVGARFAVISAGVIMNVIFAVLLFVIVCLVGIRFPAPVIGGLEEGYPAKKAHVTWENPQANPRAAKNTRLQPGDEISEIDGSEVTRWDRLFITAVLADPDDSFRMKIRRQTDKGELVGEVKLGVKPGPGPGGGESLKFGISRPLDTVFARLKDMIIDDPFQAGDRLVGVRAPGLGERKIAHHWDIAKIEELLDGRPVDVLIERDGKRIAPITVQPMITISPKVVFLKDGTHVRLTRIVSQDKGSIRAELPDGKEKVFKEADVDPAMRLLDVLGCRPRLKATGVQEGSPAEDAKLKPGDILLDYGDRNVPCRQDIADINAATVEKGTTVTVLRGGKTTDPMRIVPTIHEDRPMVGLSLAVDMSAAVVSYVRANSPADRAGLIRGDRITHVSAGDAPASAPAPTTAPAASPAPTTRPTTAPTTAPAGGLAVTNWADVVRALKGFQGRQVVLTYLRGGLRRQARIQLTKDSFDPADYRISLLEQPRFELLMGPVLKKNPLQAIAWGARETSDWILRSYATLRSLANRTVSHKAVMGPIGIGSTAIEVGRESVVNLIRFMAMISISLAVINFLPIPVVDGGHAVFLLIEKIRGKPVPVKVMNIVQIAGLLLILFVFVAVTWQDISRLVGNLW